MRYLLFTLSFLLVCFVIASLYSKQKKHTVFKAYYGKEWSCCIKGAAILCVMVSHIGNVFQIRYLNPFGAIGVSCFLFLTGYGLESSYEVNGIRSFWKKKIRIYLSYIVVEAVGLLTFWKPTSLSAVLLDLSLIKPLHPYGWYMRFLAIMYLVFYLSKFIRSKKYQTICVAVISLFIFIVGRDLVAQSAFAFLTGLIASHNRDRMQRKAEHPLAFGVFAVLGCVFLALKQIPIVRMLPALVYKCVLVCVCMFLAFAIICFVSWLQKREAHGMAFPFWKLGEYAFELYLTHIFSFHLFLAGDVTYVGIGLFFFASALFAFVLKSALAFLMDFINGNGRRANEK